MRITGDTTALLRPPPFHRVMPVLAVKQDGATSERVCGSGRELDGLAARIVRQRVGGCFWGRPAGARRPVVVYGPGWGAGSRPIRSILRDVFAAHAAQDVVLVCGRRQGALAAWGRRHGLAVAPADTDPHDLLDGATCVYAHPTTDLARLAVLRGLAVKGIPDGMSLAGIMTDIANRTDYIDPFTGAPMACADAITLLADWRRTIMANRRIGACLGMSRWKRRRIADFLATAPGHPPFRPDIRAGQRGAVAVWATRQPPGLEDAARRVGIPLWRVEDGFIRSIGLGSALTPPSSITIDTRGMYYDPAQESDLEHILATSPFDDVLRARARKLMDALVLLGISKYGPGRASALPASWDAAGRRTILVPGQVADDQSVRRGGGRIAGNLELLQAVRESNPDAFILYRPHPDVEATHRVGHVDDVLVLRLADRIDRGGAITDTIARVDEVHTLTSLAGFEALMRGRRVVTYGAPFYAGWGLTVDRGDVPPRRTRRLSLEELVAGVLILFPRYLDPVTRLPCSPEVLIERLQDARVWRPTWWMRALALQTGWRKAVARYRAAVAS
ncbi:capsule biosynthesis protein [Gluconacetobacter diazotrophicus]|uniref:Capsule biosynthesis protein n=2 Tax=Gluconacetobacter diazotrophicus TaxID=33996 RepID=A0A7W4I5I8_GLUDI|nr:capsule biosynthesis protein [Gluconacetobacter diazotrophicus]